ncbi:MAG TPA: hypothetical protein H9807_07000 [Candidatus Bacteroides merdavium]|uniref:DUF6565 domain-containing protein n=1 Tax=Candidatus Bacteroides merdavium TaxID=2838472 RepID=A0A9D2GZE9_9BACE|nr:DUF6565 domain-containing protein [uncultured Bacteroides sp.]HIZ91845.1 hypothetical protein [Candidatus Bacteroides merdavium]
MKKYILPLLAAGILSLSACQSKSSRIDDLKDFVEEIQKDSEDYTQEQWEKANEEFSQLLDKINSYEDLSEDELKEVAKLQGQYAATVFKNSGKAIMEQMEKAGAVLDGFFEGIDQGLDNNEEDENK